MLETGTAHFTTIGFNEGTSTQSTAPATQEIRNIAQDAIPVTFLEVASHIVADIAARTAGASLEMMEANRITEVARAWIADAPEVTRSAGDILYAASKRGWLNESHIALFTGEDLRTSPEVQRGVSAIASLLQEFSQREQVVSGLLEKAARYGVDLPVNLKASASGVDKKGSKLFASSVRTSKAFLRQFEVDEVAGRLVATCLRLRGASGRPEDVNDFITSGRRVSRHDRDEFEPKLVFEMAIDRGWMEVSDRRDVKTFIFHNQKRGWPIMHALEAIRREINHRTQVIAELGKQGIEIPEALYELQNIATREASNQFMALARELGYSAEASRKRG